MRTELDELISENISDRKTKVVLFLSHSESIIYPNTNISCSNPKMYDKYFLYAIKQLKSTDIRNYNNMFVVTIGRIVNSESSFTDLNPTVRYSLPSNTYHLLTHIFPLITNMNIQLIDDFNELCNRFIYRLN